MLIEQPQEPEVLFGSLSPGDVFTDRSGAPYIKIKALLVPDKTDAQHRHNSLALTEQAAPWVTWVDCTQFVRYHPDAVLRLGPPAEFKP